MLPPPQASEPDALIELERSQCLALLGSVPLGRLVHSQQALPAITPMNFSLLSDGIYVRTRSDSLVRRLADQGSVVAFEADDYDVLGRYGWSVVVLGRIEAVDDTVALTRLAERDPTPWAGGERNQVVRISLELVNGRRAGGPMRTRATTMKEDAR